MNLKKHNLKIDFITITCENLKQTQVQRIAEYFHNSFGFNTYQLIGKRKSADRILYQINNKNVLNIRTNIWNKTNLEFPGESARRLYEIIQFNEIDWNLLRIKNYKLSRMDICYDYYFEQLDGFELETVDDFLIKSRQHILKNTQTKTIKLIQNPKNGGQLGINRRSNPIYYRVYQNKNFIRFEIELKKRAVDPIQDYFFQSEFNLLETILVERFFDYSFRLFPLNSYYISWLVDFDRKYRRNNGLVHQSLSIEYFQSGFRKMEDIEKSFHLLQFLNFLQGLDSSNCSFDYIQGKKYILQTFPLTEFMHFIGIPINKQNQRMKLIQYFKQLHNNEPLIEEFSNGGFRIFASFLYSEVNKISNRWVVKTLIVEDLYTYLYPFNFPESLLTYTTQTDAFVKFTIIQSISVSRIKKIFPISEIISELKLSNSKIYKVKRDLIFLFQEIERSGILKNNIEIIYKNSKQKTINLNELLATHLTQRVKYLIFYENY